MYRTTFDAEPPTLSRIAVVGCFMSLLSPLAGMLLAGLAGQLLHVPMRLIPYLLFSPLAVGFSLSLLAIGRLLIFPDGKRGMAIAVGGVVISCMWVGCIVYLRKLG
jgi:hypothetical protein